MAADSTINVYDRPVPDGARKIRRVYAGPSVVLVAVAGESGLLALIGQLQPAPTPDDGEDPQPWAEQVALQVTRLAVDYSLLDEGRMAGTLLLGWRGRLWTLSHATATPHRDGVAALGSGEGPAVGAMDVLLSTCPDMHPAEVVGRAVTVAMARDRHSGGTVWVESLPAVDGAAA
jgi:hypothetical protein